MNKENTSKLWKMIQETGDYLLCSGSVRLTPVGTSRH